MGCIRPEGGIYDTRIQEGKYQLEVSFLGYVPATVPVNVNNSIKGLKIQLKENTLALNDVIVTAQAPKTELNTTLNIGSNALEHLQISNVSDISALLPGGKTKVPDLTSNKFSLCATEVHPQATRLSERR